MGGAVLDFRVEAIGVDAAAHLMSKGYGGQENVGQEKQDSVMQSQPLVSVLVMTYNHAEYIRQALDSVLAQVVNFEYELLISEDCSTDGTRATVMEYQQRHPERIRLLLSPENVHNNTVVTRGIEAARGKYIALLDGDDYWRVPDKLQRQVDFLEHHPECSISFHNALVVDETTDRAPWLWTPTDQPEITTLREIWMGNYIATSATMFRRWQSGTIPAWYIDMFPITDWPLHILNAERGKIGYLDAVMGVYRYHRRGYYSPLSEARKLQETLRCLQAMNGHLHYKYDDLVQVAITKYFIEWAEEYLARGDVAQARVCFATARQGHLINEHVSWPRVMALWLKLYGGQAVTRAAHMRVWAKSRGLMRKREVL